VHQVERFCGRQPAIHHHQEALLPLVLQMKPPLCGDGECLKARCLNIGGATPVGSRLPPHLWSGLEWTRFRGLNCPPDGVHSSNTLAPRHGVAADSTEDSAAIYVADRAPHRRARGHRADADSGRPMSPRLATKGKQEKQSTARQGRRPHSCFDDEDPPVSPLASLLLLGDRRRVDRRRGACSGRTSGSSGGVPSTTASSG
jgi:hypothetical protein